MTNSHPFPSTAKAAGINIIDVQVLIPGETGPFNAKIITSSSSSSPLNKVWPLFLAAWLHDPIVIRCQFNANITITCPQLSSCASVTMACPQATAFYFESKLPRTMEFLYHVQDGNQCDHVSFNNVTEIVLQQGLLILELPLLQSPHMPRLC